MNAASCSENSLDRQTGLNLYTPKLRLQGYNDAPTVHMDTFFKSNHSKFDYPRNICVCPT